MFRTELTPTPNHTKITLQSSILLVGSCFSDNIGKQLQENKLDALPNPFGVIYNPISIFKLLENSILEREFPEESFIKREEIWQNYHFHSEVSALTKEGLARNIAKRQNKVSEWFGAINQSKFLLITFGTAFVYRLKSQNEIVANCHKMPAPLFEKQLLFPKQIIKEFENLYGILPKNLSIILTVSPVRHIKDTIQLNSVSKSVLRLVCHELSEQFENVSCFPAYELLIDDLRDYRFYEADMLHPNQQAIDYLFTKFTETYLDKASQAFLGKWQKIYKSLNHKAFYPETAAHQQFLKTLLFQLENITEVEVTEEIKAIRKQIIHS